MKPKLYVLISFLLCGTAVALPDGETLASLNWDTLIGGSAQGMNLPPLVTATIDNPAKSIDPAMFELTIRYTGTSALQLKILPTPFCKSFVEGFRKIVTHHFVITGQVRYDDIPKGSYLEMRAHYISHASGYPGLFYSSRLTNGGSTGNLEGTSAWREFRLPFDSTDLKTKLRILDMNLHLTGPGTVHFREMKLIQYPDVPTPTAQTTTSPASDVPPTIAMPPEGETILALYWETITSNGSTGLTLPHLVTASFNNPPHTSDPTSTLTVTYSGVDPTEVRLVPLNFGGDFAEALKRITTHHFGITGEVSYENTPLETASLRMVSRFATLTPGFPGNTYFSSICVNGPPEAHPSGIGVWRNFALTFGDHGTETVKLGPLVELEMRLKLIGPCTVHLRNLKLVQYPSAQDTSPSTNAASAATNMATQAAMQAKAPDYRSYFTYPDTQITVEFGGGLGHAAAIPFKNHSIPKNSADTPIFQSGNGEQRPGYNSRVEWRFINKTETGDLYLVSVYENDGLIKEVPVLYTGTPLVALRQNHVEVTLEPTLTAKFKAP